MTDEKEHESIQIGQLDHAVQERYLMEHEEEDNNEVETPEEEDCVSDKELLEVQIEALKEAIKIWEVIAKQPDKEELDEGDLSLFFWKQKLCEEILGGIRLFGCPLCEKFHPDSDSKYTHNCPLGYCDTDEIYTDENGEKVSIPCYAGKYGFGKYEDEFEFGHRRIQKYAQQFLNNLNCILIDFEKSLKELEHDLEEVKKQEVLNDKKTEATKDGSELANETKDIPSEADKGKDTTNPS